MNIKFKRTLSFNLFEIYIFLSLQVTFDQFNTSLLIKSISLFIFFFIL